MSSIEEKYQAVIFVGVDRVLTQWGGDSLAFSETLRCIDLLHQENKQVVIHTHRG